MNNTDPALIAAIMSLVAEVHDLNCTIDELSSELVDLNFNMTHYKEVDNE